MNKSTKEGKNMKNRTKKKRWTEASEHNLRGLKRPRRFHLPYQLPTGLLVERFVSDVKSTKKVPKWENDARERERMKMLWMKYMIKVHTHMPGIDTCIK